MKDVLKFLEKQKEESDSYKYHLYDSVSAEDLAALENLHYTVEYVRGKSINFLTAAEIVGEREPVQLLLVDVNDKGISPESGFIIADSPHSQSVEALSKVGNF